MEALIRGAADSSVDHLSAALQEWQDHQISNFDTPSSQMLAAVPGNIQTVLEDSGKLCEKKDIIFAKFNQLLKKLGDESVERNATDKAAYDAKQEAIRAWLDGESTYRLQKEKVKEATQGAEYARSSYEKWSATVKGTQERLDKMKKDYAKEFEDIKTERLLIQEILRLLGIMEDQPLDDASKKAGGYVAGATTAEHASPLTLAEVKSKVAMLSQQAKRGDSPIGEWQVKTLQSKLASFAETDEVKKLLEEMIKSLDQREGVLTKALEDTKKELESHTAKLTDFEKQVVDLSNAADKAKQAEASADLQRQTLNGVQINKGEAYKTEHAEYVIVAPPADRAIVIIKLIMQKVEDFCKAGSAPAAA